MSVNPDTSVCGGCGTPTWGNTKTCHDCKRKKVTDKPCQFPGCPDTYRAKGPARYCPTHKSMDSADRMKAIRAAKLNG